MYVRFLSGTFTVLVLLGFGHGRPVPGPLSDKITASVKIISFLVSIATAHSHDTLILNGLKRLVKFSLRIRRSFIINGMSLQYPHFIVDLHDAIKS